jgi:hypothetical protein
VAESRISPRLVLAQFQQVAFGVLEIDQPLADAAGISDLRVGDLLDAAEELRAVLAQARDGGVDVVDAEGDVPQAGRVRLIEPAERDACRPTILNQFNPRAGFEFEIHDVAEHVGEADGFVDPFPADRDALRLAQPEHAGVKVHHRLEIADDDVDVIELLNHGSKVARVSNPCICGRRLPTKDTKGHE